MAKTCPTCGAANRDDARFCSSCAGPFPQEVICPSCGTHNLSAARFCHQCATPLAGASIRAGLGTGLLAPSTMLAGRYIIIQKIGQGGMAAVYKAADTRLGHKVVAIKEMSDAAITDPLEKQQARQAFEQEAQMLARLNHPNLPRVTDHFTEAGKQYLVMDFVEGHTLEEILNQTRGFLSEKQAVDWAVQLCDVLDYLHSQQPPVIFRDLKPGNIMLDQGGKVKLIDFGIARLFKPGKATDTIAFGTTGYAPPEQYGKGQTDARSDIYALGATLHHLLTRRDPAVDPFIFPPACTLNASVSEALDQVIARALNQDPNQRWPSALEMRRALTSSISAVEDTVAICHPRVPVTTVGVLTTPGGQALTLASWGRRAGAYLIDLIVASLLLSIISLPFVGINALASDPRAADQEEILHLISILMQLVWVLFSFLYWVWPVAFWGQTAGKGILGIQVVTHEGHVPGLSRALWRAVLVGIALLMASWLIGLIDFLWPLWNPKRQALHDRLAGTYVVRKEF